MVCEEDEVLNLTRLLCGWAVVAGRVGERQSGRLWRNGKLTLWQVKMGMGMKNWENE